MKKLYLILLFVHIISSGISAHGSKKAELTFPRRVVMEEFTGTWCGNCPRGMVGISGSIKAPIVCGEKQGYTDIITTLNNKVIQDKSHLYAVVLLIDRTTGRIVNADRAEIQPYGTSAIETTVATQPADGKTYNLQGQQVTCPDSKGIYIRNGKKHLTI